MDEVPGDLIAALEEAAEFEHAVLLQYLFAAASLKRREDEGASVLELERIRGWERTLLAIAREEMAHLAAVSNLLIAVGAKPWLVRPGLAGGRLAGGPGTAVLVLERFGRRSLERFVALERDESGEGEIAGHYGAIKREIARLAAAGHPVVRRTPTDRVDGWGISGAVRLRPVNGAGDMLEVIDAIIGQGGAEEAADSHLRRLRTIEAELDGETCDPARRVVANPVLGTGAGTPIGNRSTAAAAAAFAGAYQAMLLSLELYYALLEVGSPAAVGARRVAAGLMGGVLRPLGEVLAELPIGAGTPGWTCGPTFGWDGRVALAGERRESWRTLEALLAGARAQLEALGGRPPRLGPIGENLGLAARLIGRAAGEDR